MSRPRPIGVKGVVPRAKVTDARYGFLDVGGGFLLLTMEQLNCLLARMAIDTPEECLVPVGPSREVWPGPVFGRDR